MSNNTLSVKFNFFQIQKSADFSLDIYQVLNRIIAKDRSKRQQDVKGSLRILDSLQLPSSSGISYIFRSKRIRGLPSKSDVDWVISTLGLSPSEALDEPVAMAIDPTGSVAAISSNRYGIFPNTICEYIGRFFPTAQFNLVPTLTKGTMERVAKAKQVRKVHVKFAGVLNYESLKNANMDIKQAEALYELLSSPSLDLTWSVGRAKEGLSERVRGILNVLKKYHDNEDNSALQTLDATIQEDVNGHLKCSTVDLLADRIISFQNVALTSGRELDRDSLLNASISALKEKADELKIYIPPREVC